MKHLNFELIIEQASLSDYFQILTNQNDENSITKANDKIQILDINDSVSEDVNKRENKIKIINLKYTEKEEVNKLKPIFTKKFC